MGKKHVATQKEEELLKATNKLSTTKEKEIKVPFAHKFKKAKVYILSSYNNTIITLNDEKGNMFFWKSAGSLGFSGTKKGTPYAGAKVAEIVSDIIKAAGIEEIEVLIKGIGSSRESSLRTLIARGLNIVSIKDVTPIPHNGCKPPKLRRV